MGRHARSLAVVLVLFLRLSFGQTDSLSLSSGIAAANGTVSLNLNLTSPTGSEPTALQWTFTYPAATVVAISASAGPAATGAGKTLSCTPKSGAYTCVLYGMNANPISNGILAALNLTIASGVTTSSVGVVNTVAVSGSGSNVNSSGTGGTVTGPGTSLLTLASFSCIPTSLAASSSTTCTVALSAAAPAGGSLVALSSNNSLLPVPTSITVGAGATSATFTATAGAIPSAQTATLTASLGTSVKSAAINLVPLSVVSVAVSTVSLVGGTPLGVTVTLNGAAPSTGALVALSGSNSAFPSASITVPTGATSQMLNLPTTTVTTSTVTTITASYNGSSVTSSQFTVNPVSSSSGGTATFVKTDLTTQGWWKGIYGGDGYNVINDSIAYPSYVTVTPSANALYTWAASTSDTRALQKASSATDRIAACWYNASPFTIDLAFNDTAIHQVALYLIDWDNWYGRNETVTILDAKGTVLDTRTISNFLSGQYLVWNLSGHVIIRFTNNNSLSNAVVSGIFFGGSGSSTTPINPVQFVKTDTTTAGSWKGVYGADGYNVIGDGTSYPSYVTVTPAGYASYTWAASTSDTRALQKASSTIDRVAACWYSSSLFTIDLLFNDTTTHQVALYVLDFDAWGGGRTQNVDILDASGNVLDTRTVSNFLSGQYLVWNLSGHVVVRIRNSNPASNAVASGIFFH